MTYLALPQYSTEPPRLAGWEDAFSEEQLNNIVSTCESYNKMPAETSGHKVTDLRSTTVSWIPPNAETAYIFSVLLDVAAKCNKQYFNFDLSGFHENIQYTVYEEGDHYNTWHMDSLPKQSYPVSRKLTLIMQLSGPEDYEGGDLEIMDSQYPFAIKKKKGDILVIPAYILHRVTPVTKGIRRTLVTWAGGPTFR